MSHVEPIQSLSLSQIDTLAFAGGGNRCWWQAGAVAQLLELGWRLPPQLVGTSAGAGVAASCLTDGPRAALEACLRLYAGNTRIFDWKGLTQLRLKFAHQHIYPAWIDAFLNAANFESLRQSASQLQVAITRPAKALGLAGSIATGTLAYIVDKQLWHSIHPRLPRLIGLRQDFRTLQHCSTVEEAQTLLAAAAAAPPFMSARRVDGVAAIDGGYTDNAPLPAQTAAQSARTLILLTRHYPKLPAMFRWHGRHYWQPSSRIPVSTWDCTARTTVREAFVLGEQDAVAALRGGQLRVE
ncbi:patatin-like phospholipase family protein [Crenobacter sp. SG2305]|uniref:patatin-like phospholipase family protein n=1 Tax=Crenobacter oryzisoli TaxID=3056844 RepID=UPI0025AB58A8|nr:patatin-like phospholipase family protein [Crenobacter sp. SG2305]MDN0085070.1 patatin-like phospholipase family protein [Crenobacter sp. SG2305]